MTGWRYIAPLVCGFLLAVLIAPSAAKAHEARPAYLEIKETAPARFSLLWRTPVMAGMRLAIVLTIPDARNLKSPEVEELSDSVVERRWIDAGPNGLAGKRIEFVGLQLTITDVLFAWRCSTAEVGQPSLVHRNRGWRLARRKPGRK